mmetsp:Transcript_95969/g.170323  ORF Transcript_95969/g.170323 Transcript_95969/m.170323 type:complete len:231 (+) Transcript_95969:69-761(+)
MAHHRPGWHFFVRLDDWETIPSTTITEQRAGICWAYVQIEPYLGRMATWLVMWLHLISSEPKYSDESVGKKPLARPLAQPLAHSLLLQTLAQPLAQRQPLGQPLAQWQASFLLLFLSAVFQGSEMQITPLLLPTGCLLQYFGLHLLHRPMFQPILVHPPQKTPNRYPSEPCLFLSLFRGTALPAQLFLPVPHLPFPELWQLGPCPSALGSSKRSRVHQLLCLGCCRLCQH